MIYSKIKYLILILFILNACSRYDYSIHKPKVRFKPSVSSLERLNRETIGKPYVWAAENDNCYDCSGLTYYTLGSMGIEIPRTADQQYHSGIPVSRSELKKGDLVFFGNGYRANHVGIYIGNGKFQHASSAKKRVVISSLNNPYYRRHYMGARRFYNFNDLPAYRSQVQEVAQQERQAIKLPFVTLYLKNKNTPPQTVNRGKYYILVGTYKNYPSNLITKLKLSAQPVTTKYVNGYYKVLIGPFNDINEAKSDISYNPDLTNAAIIRG